MLQALIFDVDGTLADTEMAHLAAFNHAFEQTGIGWHWDFAQYKQLLNVSGGKERLMHYWKQQQGGDKALNHRAVVDTLALVHEIKNAAYDQSVRQGAVQMRPGVLSLIREAGADGLKLAIATTTSPENISVLLRQSLGADWKNYFLVIEDAFTAPNKKPHPQAYLQALARLKIPAKNCLAFEDSENGLRAARAAGLATLITPTAFTQHHDFTGAMQVFRNLSGVTVAQLRDLHTTHFLA